MADRTRTRLGLVVLFLLAGCRLGPTTTVFLGGPILTMDAGNSVVEALAIEGDTILAAGTTEEVRAAVGDSARVVDLDGRALLPGFVDAHGHFPGTGLYAVHADLNSPPIGEIETIEDIVAIMRMRAADTSSRRWLIGMGYDDTLLNERRHPTRADLDRASSEHAVAIMHISGHLAVANSKALEAMNIGPATPDPEGGRIVRDPHTGEPTGVLEETAAADVLERIQSPSILDSLKILRAAAEDYAQAGVTTAQNGLADARQLRALELASRLGLLPIRLVAWPSADTARDMLAEGEEFDSYDPDWFRVGAVKLVADGSIQGYTGYLTEPYHEAPATHPEFRGYPRMPAEELDEQLAEFHSAGLQVAIHGNGDAAIDMVLDAVEGALSSSPDADARPVLVHAQMARDDQLERMKRLGVVPSFFVLHTFYWGDRHREVFIGPRRSARISPLAGALKRDLLFTIHADAPVVPMEPLRLVWSAVNRRSRSGQLMGVQERISPMQALRAVTIDAAYQHFEEEQKGSLEPGKLADLVILSSSPLENPGSIHEIRVLETFVGGRSVFRSSDW